MAWWWHNIKSIFCPYISFHYLQLHKAHVGEEEKRNRVHYWFCLKKNVYLYGLITYLFLFLNVQADWREFTITYSLSSVCCNGGENMLLLFFSDISRIKLMQEYFNCNLISFLVLLSQHIIQEFISKCAKPVILGLGFSHGIHALTHKILLKWGAGACFGLTT